MMYLQILMVVIFLTGLGTAPATAQALHTSQKPAVENTPVTLPDTEKARILELYQSMATTKKAQPSDQGLSALPAAPTSANKPALQHPTPAQSPGVMGMMLKQVSEQSTQGTPMKTIRLKPAGE